MTQSEIITCNGIIHAASTAATIVGRTTSQIVAEWTPVAGNIINAATATTITETIGWLMADEFERQRG